ncbi:hypothetical protein RHGRI_011711 [Rhododendron griersonianum]|uniref:Uncharacterized protein n=1 Tax=Rhododendron griersonianum TaxID=479676 RepID=A0AAV6KN65_9ERIC|nr:hypothetical protein RHGRI_011711 [Rhododendron griersonianum]
MPLSRVGMQMAGSFYLSAVPIVPGVALEIPGRSYATGVISKSSIVKSGSMHRTAPECILKRNRQRVFGMLLQPQLHHRLILNKRRRLISPGHQILRPRLRKPQLP